MYYHPHVEYKKDLEIYIDTHGVTYNLHSVHANMHMLILTNKFFI